MQDLGLVFEASEPFLFAYGAGFGGARFRVQDLGGRALGLGFGVEGQEFSLNPKP